MSRLIDADKLLECVEESMLNNTHRNGTLRFAMFRNIGIL